MWMRWDPCERRWGKGRGGYWRQRSNGIKWIVKKGKGNHVWRRPFGPPCWSQLQLEKPWGDADLCVCLCVRVRESDSENEREKRSERERDRYLSCLIKPERRHLTSLTFLLRWSPATTNIQLYLLPEVELDFDLAGLASLFGTKNIYCFLYNFKRESEGVRGQTSWRPQKGIKLKQHYSFTRQRANTKQVVARCTS